MSFINRDREWGMGGRGGGRSLPPSQSPPLPLPHSLSPLYSSSLFSEMVATTAPSSSTSSSHQYITDYVPTTGGKSPLAMLAKTCETIGLPETPAKKVRGVSSSSSPNDKKGSSPNGLKKENTKTVASPKGPITTTFPAALGFPPMGAFPFMGFPGMPGGFPPMASSMMAPPGASMMSLMGMKPPCPNIMMGRQCTQAGCPSCQPPAPSFDQMWMNGLNNSAYQAFLAAAASMPSTSGASMPSFPLLPTSLSLPSTSTPSTSTSTSSSSSAHPSSSRSSSATKVACQWEKCDKTFDTPDDLTDHLKEHVAHSSTPSTPTPTEKSSPKMTSSSTHSVRFNPYAKPSSIPVSMSSMPMNYPLLMSGLFPQML
ncbi:hypothetical protein PENTCL1PPCAC_18352, partial [Pristionchus entomophagus]